MYIMLCIHYVILATYFAVVNGNTLRRHLRSVQYGCKSPQFSEVGKPYFVKCSFPSNFNAIYWYNVTIDENSAPIAGYISKERSKLGTQYIQGNMDVLLNGSLAINNVTSQHDGELKVGLIAENDAISTYYVSLLVFIRPTQLRPAIGLCEDQVCYRHYSHSERVTCNVNAAKPPVGLLWGRQIGNEVIPVKSENEIEAHADGTYNAFATFSIGISENNLIVLWVCESYWNPSKVYANSSILVDYSENSYNEISNINRTEAILVNNIQSVNCGETDGDLVLWKIARENGVLEVLGWNVMNVGMFYDQDKRIEISPAGTLVFNGVKVTDEGIYMCVFDNGVMSNVEHIAINVMVPPFPPYPLIAECNDQADCTLRGKSGRLTCSLYGVRPIATLNWIYDEPLPIELTHFRSETMIKDNVFDITLSVDYEITRTPYCTERLVIRCIATKPAPMHFQPITRVTVIPEGPCESELEPDVITLSFEDKLYDVMDNGYYIVRVEIMVAILALFVAIILTTCVTACCLTRCRDRRQRYFQDANQMHELESMVL